MQHAETVRHAAVNGHFYPRSALRLKEEIQQHLANAHIPALSRVRGVIAPHAGYQYSGAIAAHSFCALATLPPAPYTVYLLGPAHYLSVRGVGLCSSSEFETPLGTVQVATQRVEELLALGAPYHVADRAHVPEHSLEVELPFLQVILPIATIVPMLLDDLANYRRIGADIAAICAKDEQSLIVVSSDLSHFHPYAEAVRLDRGFVDAVIQEDIPLASVGEACGRIPILCLITVAKTLGWRAHLLAYGNSGTSSKPDESVVGYVSVAFCEG